MIATCPEHELLRRYANGLASELESDELTMHVRDCADCQAWLLGAENLEDTLVSQLKSQSTNEFENEPECKSAMTRALGAISNIDDLDVSRTDIPESIGDYQIVRDIGRGGMGNVFLANHKRLDRTVAVKVLASHRLSDPRMHDRFEKEMRAIGSLSHPNIVTAHDAREVEGMALLVTEWVDGLSLKDILQRTGPLSIANACQIGVAVCDALIYIEQQGLVHRDLKPSNLMINRDGELKVLDLGLARLRGSDQELDATATGQALGTADYVAPEQVNDAREVDIFADIYSLGCTLYKLLSGRNVFDDAAHQTAFAKLTAHVSETPMPLCEVAPEVPAAIGKLVDQMLAKLPSERPAPSDIRLALSKRAGDADLSELVSDAMQRSATTFPVARNTTTTSAKPSWRKRRVSMLAAIAAGFAGLGLGLLAGVLITIEHANGNKTQVDVPEGSHATIDKDGNVGVRMPPGVAKNETPPGSAQFNIDPSTLPVVDDTKRLNGVWRIDSIMMRGGTPWVQSAENAFLVFHDRSIVVMQKSRPLGFGKFELDSDLQQMTVTLDPNEPKQQAIYSIKTESEGRMLTFPELVLTVGKDIHNGPRPYLQRLSLSKVELPVDKESALVFMQHPANVNAMHSIVMHQRLVNGASPAALATATRSVVAEKRSDETAMNLRKLALAFHNFQTAYRFFPASKNSPRFGKPIEEGEYPMSWRVAILPFVDQADLFEQYDPKQPWDSDHNLKLLSKMPKVFRRPGQRVDSTTTGYVGFADENSALGLDMPTKMRDIVDGTSNTVLLFEAETEIPWTKPEDLTLDDLESCGLLDLEVVYASRVDGSVAELIELTAKSLRELVIINDTLPTLKQMRR